MALKKFASLWIGGNLTWFEQLCLKSFADHGHDIVLYSYEPIENVPDGVKSKDAREYFPYKPFYAHNRTGSPAIHADLWRINMIKNSGRIWVDADILCARDWSFDDDFVFGLEDEKTVCNAVLQFPKSSGTLNEMLEFFSDPYVIAPWLPEQVQDELKKEADEGNPVHITKQAWGYTGPTALTYFLEKNDEMKYVKSPEYFYPVPFGARAEMLLTRTYNKTVERITPKSYGVHLWARRTKRRLLKFENHLPRGGSFLDKMIKVHEIDVHAAPIIDKPTAEAERMDDPVLRRKIGILLLNKTYSIDKICRDYGISKPSAKEILRELVEDIKAGEVNAQ